MSHSNVTGARTMLCTKLESLNVELSLPDARYKKNTKKIEISVDGKVQWSYKWFNTFEPLLGQNLHIPLTSNIKISLIRKHRIRHHLLGSYSGRAIDFFTDKETPLTLQGDRRAACVTITMGLSPMVDHQQALNASVDANLGRLDNNQILAEGLVNADRAFPCMLDMDYAVETHGKYIAPLGQALRLMNKLIDNVGEGHLLLAVGWSLLSSLYTVVQQRQVQDRHVQMLAENFRELVGVAGDCPVAEIRGTPRIIQSIERIALEVASLIDEHTKSSSTTHLDMAQIADVEEKCYAALSQLYKMLRPRLTAYTRNCVKEIQEGVQKLREGIKEIQEDLTQRDARKLFDQIWDWLKAHDTSINHAWARDTCLEGTGSWFPKDEPGTTLWISGGHEYSLRCAVWTVLRSSHEAGFGKTVLFSTAVEDVRRHASARGPTCCSAYFYLAARPSDGASRRFDTLLRSVLDQLCSQQADIPDAIKRLYGVDRQEHPQLTLVQLKTTLGEIVKGFDEVYILIDALDECDSQLELLNWMKSLQSTTPGLHLLATSRPERIIEGHMSHSSHVRISLTSELLDDDIKTYVDERVEASATLKLVLTEEMKKKLRVKAAGMFRLVALWMDEFGFCYTMKDIKNNLEHPPTVTY